MPILGKVGSQEITGCLALLATAWTSSGATPRMQWPNTQLLSMGTGPATPARAHSQTWDGEPKTKGNCAYILPEKLVYLQEKYLLKSHPSREMERSIFR